MKQPITMLLAAVSLVIATVAAAIGMTVQLPYTVAELLIVAGLVGWVLAIVLGLRHWKSAAGKTVVLAGLACLLVMGIVYLKDEPNTAQPVFDPPRESRTQPLPE